MQALKKCLVSLWLVVAPLGTAQAETVDVLMQTDLGDITITLYPAAAPKTVANFLRYVDAGYYQGGNFYRVVRLDNQVQNAIKIEVVQGGMRAGSGGPPFVPIPHETTEQTGLLHRDGVISMARLDAGTATSEFFICINDQPELDFGGRRNPDRMGFAAFGKVTHGMNLVRQIQQGKTAVSDPDKPQYTNGQMLVKPVMIRDVVRIPEK